MGRPKGSRNAKKSKAPKAVKPVDQEVKGSKKAAAPDKGPLSGVGHNVTKVRELIVPYAKRYNKILDTKAEDAASHMADVRVLIEDAANALGCKRRIVREALQRDRRIKTDAEKDAERDKDELSQRDTIEDALGHFSDMPLAVAAIDADKKAKAKAAPAPKKAANGKVVQMSKPEEASDDEGDEGHDDEAQPAAA